MCLLQPCNTLTFTLSISFISAFSFLSLCSHAGTSAPCGSGRVSPSPPVSAVSLSSFFLLFYLSLLSFFIVLPSFTFYLSLISSCPALTLIFVIIRSFTPPPHSNSCFCIKPVSLKVVILWRFFCDS